VILFGSCGPGPGSIMSRALSLLPRWNRCMFTYAPVHNYARASNNKRLFLDPHSFGTANAFWRWRRGLSKGARRHGAAHS